MCWEPCCLGRPSWERLSASVAEFTHTHTHSEAREWGIPLPPSNLLLDVLVQMKCAVKQPCLRNYLPNGSKGPLVLVGDDHLDGLVDEGEEGLDKLPEANPVCHVLVSKEHSKFNGAIELLAVLAYYSEKMVYSPKDIWATLAWITS